jgi:class 3 adenylate cyclase
MVSSIVHDQVRDKLSFRFEDMGEQSVKNISRPVGVHRVQLTEREPIDKSGAVPIKAKPTEFSF